MEITERDKLQREINALLESNRLAWVMITNQCMAAVERDRIRKAIAARDSDLDKLLQRKWAIERAKE